MNKEKVDYLTSYESSSIEEQRTNALNWLTRHKIQFNYLTCDECSSKEECPYAYDPYNTDGDCLAIK